MSPDEALERAIALADLRPVRSRTGLGPLTRWRLSRTLARAASELALPLPTDPNAAHVADPDPAGATVALLQHAWLRRRGVALAPSLGGRAALHERYYGELARRPRNTLSSKHRLLIAGGVALALGGGLALAIASSAPEPPPSLPAGPLGTLAAEREPAWVEAITDWVVALDRLSRARHDGELPSVIAERERNLALHREAVLAGDLAATLGEEAMASLARMLDAAETATRGGDGWDDREEAFAEAVRAANRALFSRGVGYFFDSYAARFDDDRAEAALYTFRILARQRFVADGKPIDALHLRRVDRLNIVQYLLGYTSKRMDVAVLLVDKLEAEVATRLGPALEPGREMPLHMKEEGEGTTAWLDVRAKAGQVVREAYYGALPGQQQALSELGELLARRSDLVLDWNQRLEDRGIELREFEDIDVDPDYRDRFQRMTSLEARKVLDDIQRRLETDEHRGLFLRLVERHTRPVELHEVQHRIDYERGDDFEVPAALLEALGIPDSSAHKDSDEVRRIAYELSAYTAELARDPEWARVNLTLLAEHLYDGSGGAEGWSAVLILEGLARRLALAHDPIVVPGQGADLDRVAALHLVLLSRPGRALSAAAAALWQEWFGEPLVALERQDR